MEPAEIVYDLKEYKLFKDSHPEGFYEGIYAVTVAKVGFAGDWKAYQACVNIDEFKLHPVGWLNAVANHGQPISEHEAQLIFGYHEISELNYRR